MLYLGPLGGPIASGESTRSRITCQRIDGSETKKPVDYRAQVRHTEEPMSRSGLLTRYQSFWLLTCVARRYPLPMLCGDEPATVQPRFSSVTSRKGLCNRIAQG